MEQWSGFRGCGADNSIQLAWHPQWAELLAIAAGSQVLECSLPAAMEPEPAELVCVTSQPPPGTAAVPFGNNQPATAIAFSLDGTRLAAGRDDGNVSLSCFRPASDIEAHLSSKPVVPRCVCQRGHLHAFRQISSCYVCVFSGPAHLALQVMVAAVSSLAKLSEADILAAAYVGAAVSSLTWLSDNTLLVGSRSNANLQTWRLDPELGETQDWHICQRATCALLKLAASGTKFQNM